MSASPTINTQPTPVPGPSSSPTSPLGKEHLEGEALVSALKQQLEFYFSKQNLATDAYLLSHMNASKYVPVEIIAGFRKVRMLTEDRAFLVDVMKQCRNLVVDENGTHVRPNIKMERTTLILRDIPASTPADDIKQIFATPSAPAKPISVRSDIDDTWFVTFESEEACTDTALWLPSQTFQGKPVKCRVKSENLLRGFYYPNSSKETQPVTTPIPIPQVNPYANPAGAPFYGNGYIPYGGAYPYAAYPQQAYGQPSQSPPQVNQRLDGKHERRNKVLNGTQAPNPRGKRGKGADATGSVQVVAAASGAVTVTGVVSPTNATAAPAASVPGTGKKALKKARKAAAAAAAAATTSTASATDTTTAPATAAAKAPDVALGIEHFPALPNNPTIKKTTSISGYTSSFVEYDREAMASIIAALMSQSYPKPDTFPTDPESVIVRKTVLSTCQLLQPFPVIYPASPSPELAAQPIHSGAALMPFLDLGVGPAAAVLAGRAPHVEQPKKKAPAPATQQAPKPKKGNGNTPTASAAPAPTPAPATTSAPATSTSAPANGKPKATKPSKPKYQKAGTAAAAAAAAAASAASISASSTPTPTSAPAPTPAPVTPAVPVVTAASIVAANANLPLQPHPKQVAAAKEAKEREAREKAEKLAAAEAAKLAAQQKKPKYQPKGTKAANKDKTNKQENKDRDAATSQQQQQQQQRQPQQEAKSNEPPKIKWAAKVGSVDPAITLAKLAKAKKEAEEAKEAKAKAEADAKNPPSSSPTSSSSTTSSSTSASTPASTSSSPSPSTPSSSSSSSAAATAAAAAAAAAAEEEANKKLSYAEMARRAKNAAAAAAAAAAANNKSNGVETPTSPASPSH